MRVAQVAPYFYPHIGGVESHVQTLSEGLVNRGHDVTVYTSEIENAPEREIINGVEVVRVKERANIFYTPITPQLKKIILEGKHDVVHAHTPPPLSAYYATKACKRSRIPLVITYHCDPELSGIIGRITSGIYQRTLSRYTFKRTKKIIVHTKTYGATSRAIWNYDVSVIPSAVNPDRFGEEVDPIELRKRYDLEGKDMVLFVGRLVPHKGLDYLVDSARNTSDNVRYVIVGQGPYLDSLRRSVRESGLTGKVIFTGKVPYDELPLFFVACDIFVLPSISRLEAFGLVVLEAMASSKPVIISNIPGVTELVTEGEEGLHAEPMNAEDLADKINKLLSDPELMKRMGEKGRKKVEREYTWDKVVAQVEAVYEEVI